MEAGARVRLAPVRGASRTGEARSCSKYPRGHRRRSHSAGGKSNRRGLGAAGTQPAQTEKWVTRKGDTLALSAGGQSLCEAASAWPELTPKLRYLPGQPGTGPQQTRWQDCVVAAGPRPLTLGGSLLQTGWLGRHLWLDRHLGQHGRVHAVAAPAGMYEKLGTVEGRGRVLLR